MDRRGGSQGARHVAVLATVQTTRLYGGGVGTDDGQCVPLHGCPAAAHGLVVGSRTAGDSSPAVARSGPQG